MSHHSSHILPLLLALPLALCTSCYDDQPIGDPIDIHADYVLPQGDASAEDNRRIEDYLQRYGSYFIYNFEVDSTGFSRDVTWVQKTGSASERFNIVITKGQTQYVGAMLDLLEKTWLQFFPEDFLAKGGIPYRVFICDNMYQWRQVGDWYQRLDHEYMFFDYSLTICGMNEHLLSMTQDDRVAFKRMLLPAVWQHYYDIHLLDVPAEFYELTDYTRQPEYPDNSPEALEQWRRQGYLPFEYTADGKPVEFWNGNYYWGNARRDDLNAYLMHLRDLPASVIQQYLDNPAYSVIRRKYEILLSHYRDKYGIDLRAMGDAEL